ncbi:MAG: nucleotide exchange factor GrpE [Candidatus Yanofskybacteria bacterium RIFCSPLOWO2_12_FULL_41_8]|nr:MAG: nucleotide exchange factor GrpE [Candidatus Yanofskybacteria bacterium RIFCSPLOWO2_12_FULL_41_8]
MEEKDIEQLNKELEESKKQAEEYLNNWKRERADFLNYKKEEARRMEEFLKFSIEGIIMELIDVVDGIEVARKNLPESKELEEWTDGFDGSLDKLDKFLEKFGVEKIKIEQDTSTGS